MIAECRKIDSGFPDDGKYILFIGKLNFSTVNSHKSHIKTLLCFHVNGIKGAVVFAGTALDTQFVVNMISLLAHAGDRSNRTVLCTFAAAFAELRINKETAHSSTAFGGTLVFQNVLLVLIAEGF